MKKIYIIAFLLSFLLMSCGSEVTEKDRIYYSTGVVFSGSINLDDSYVGYIKGDKMVNLATKVGGRVTNLYVKEGDYVKKGDLLLTLDSHEAKSGYSTASNIIATLYSMRNDTEAMFNDQIKSMEAKVEQVKLGNKGIENGLKDTINITNSQLETAKVGVETSKVNLEHTRTVLDTKEKHVYDNSKDAIVSAVILDTNILNFVDSLLGITDDNKDKNDSFEDYLGVKNSSLNTEAKTKFYETLVKYNAFKEFYDSKIDGKKPSYDDIIKGLSDGEDLAENFKTLLSITYDILDASIANVSLPQTTIDNYKNQISNFGNNIEASLITVSGDYFLGLKGSRQSIDDFNRESKMQIDLLEKQLQLAEKTYEQYKAMSEGQVNEVTTKSNITGKQLDEILAGLASLKQQKQSKLREIDAKIDEAKGQQNSAGIMINNGKIVSPITGIVTSKMVKVGQVVGGGIPLLSVSNIDNLEVDINISEEQSKNINISDEVLLEIEGVDKQLTGKISNINQSKDLITKKVGVKISIINNDNQIKIGSFTKVIFKNNSGNNGILITNDAIISQFMIPGVYTIEENKVVFRNIEIVKQNDSFSEVKGINIGDIIITKGKENLYDGEILK